MIAMNDIGSIARLFRIVRPFARVAIHLGRRMLAATLYSGRTLRTEICLADVGRGTGKTRHSPGVAKSNMWSDEIVITPQ